MKSSFDSIVLNKIKSIIRNETGLGNEKIRSSEIYDKLISAGVGVEQLAVNEVIEQLEKEKLITINREGGEEHGGYMITWVSGKL